ncbi:hypothetical protein [Baekduia sp.]|uniref:hypothetical protein n=1 Tax=Baekduia sp. TaxID=2600305 RepID=UPI002D1FA632|nr:hypothetical protein [Baekduia sp.]
MHLAVSAHARRAILLCVTAVALDAPAGAGAASVAYIDNGEAWVSSLDGTQKARLASPVVNSDGQTEKWLDIAQSDGGRIVAVRNVPGRISRFSWFKIWEPDGSSTVEGPLNAPSGWAVYVYPLGFDITADGKHLVYGFSNSSGCCPISFQTGIYARPATNSVLEPIHVSGQRYPSLFGGRIVAASGNTVSVQQAAAAPYGPDFDPWLDTSGTGLEQRRTDVAANGQLAAFELEQWNGGTQAVGKIGVLAIQGVDTSPSAPAAVDCYLPTTGVAHDVSLSMDAKHIAWDDDQGLKVAGTPTTSADPCVLPTAPVVISASAQHGAIGGAGLSGFLPAPPPAEAPPGGGGGGTTPGTPSGGTTPSGTTPSGTTPTPGSPAPGAAPVATLPARVTASALARGIVVTVKVGAPGTVRVTATVPARRLGRRGKPIVVATGSARATRAGTVKLRLRLNATARKRAARLKGARLTLRIVHGTRTTTRTITLR